MKLGIWEAIKELSTQYECTDNSGHSALINKELFNEHKSTEKKDLTGCKFGDWEVKEYKGNSRYRCVCSCGTEKNLRGYELRYGRTFSCGHNTNLFRDYTNKIYGTYKIIRYLGDKKWEGKCLCGRTLVIPSYKLANQSKIYCHRCKGRSVMHEWVTEVKEYIHQIYKSDIVEDIDSRGNSLIAIKDKNIIIILYSNANNTTPPLRPRDHQNQNLAVVKSKYRLIQIFEYEWASIEYREKLKQLLNTILNSHSNKVVYARNTRVEVIDSNSTVKEFTDAYHLQGHINFNIAIGLYDNKSGELLGIMTFGKPRFKTHEEYELLRLIWKSSVVVVGGAEKLFKAFIERYNPVDIVSYCDISKFTGGVYSRIGFTLDKNADITPNYKWVKLETNEILPRYKTMKHKLLAAGLGDSKQTETQIMENLGYKKIYDSGNLKFIWSRQ